MTIEAEILELFEEGNPVPDLDGLGPVDVDAAGYLATIEQRSTQTDTHPTGEDSITKPNRLRVVAAVAILVLGAAVMSQTQAPDVATTIPVATNLPASPPTKVPLGLEVVGLDGSTSNLGLPADAWMADLTADGRYLAFLTESFSVGFCGLCGNPVRLAIVEAGSSEGAFVWFDEYDPGGVIDLHKPATQLAWSPDGKHLAFQGRSRTHRGDNLDIYVADFSATPVYSRSAVVEPIEVPVLRLTDDDAIDEFPAWSPDGTIIYYDNRGNGAANSDITLTSEIWSVPASGGTPTRLTDNDVADMQPDASPDGTVAYWHDGEIWVMDPDGTAQSRLSIVPANLGWNPRWSPDGTKLALLQYDDRSPRAAFEANRIHATDLPPMNVVVVDVTDGTVANLGVQVASFFNPVSWLPDGSGLLVVRYR